ncbi:DUF1187 family protein [Escherichia coli]|nr:DUF1187 family protein [Escherichia coli]
MKGKKYKVTAITHKADNPPVEWIYYSESALTKTECEIRFYKSKETGRSFGEKVRLGNFICTFLNRKLIMTCRHDIRTLTWAELSDAAMEADICWFF